MWEAARPRELFRGWDLVLEGLWGGYPAYGAGEHQMMVWVGDRREHGETGGWWGAGVEFWVVNPSKVLTPVLWEPRSATHPRDTPVGQLWGHLKPRCGVLTDFWGTQARKALFPCIPPQAKRDLQPLMPDPLWPHPVPSCPSCFPTLKSKSCLTFQGAAVFLQALMRKEKNWGKMKTER